MKSTHNMVSLLLEHPATGLTPDDIVRSYPSLVQEPVQAAIAYAADDLVQDGLGEPAARGRTVRMADAEWRYRPPE
jgi:hypothetical protein